VLSSGSLVLHSRMLATGGVLSAQLHVLSETRQTESRPLSNRVVMDHFSITSNSTSGADLTDPTLREDTGQHLLKTVHIDRFCEMVVES
jgi:hypothetical protein